jgi:hypothetical protein
MLSLFLDSGARRFRSDSYTVSALLFKMPGVNTAEVDALLDGRLLLKPYLPLPGALPASATGVDVIGVALRGFHLISENCSSPVRRREDDRVTRLLMSSFASSSSSSSSSSRALVLDDAESAAAGSAANRPTLERFSTDAACSPSTSLLSAAVSSAFRFSPKVPISTSTAAVESAGNANAGTAVDCCTDCS